jgi:hypothetical protein
MNFLKGSVCALGVLVVTYSPFIVEADTAVPTFHKNGFVTSATTIFPDVSIFKSETFIVIKSSPTPIPTLQKQLLVRKIVTPTPTTVLITDIRPIISPTIIQNDSSSSNIPYSEHFQTYSEKFNVDKQLLIRIAKCESGFRHDAVNGPYLGMFQYLSSTWVSARKEMGENSDESLRTNPEEAIKTTAWKIAHGGISAWPVCGS